MKTVFAIVAVSHPDLIGAAVARRYPNDNYRVADAEWLVADEGTSQNVCERLGIVVSGDKGLSPGQVGNALVVAISGYYGTAPAIVWEWIKSKWGSA